MLITFGNGVGDGVALAVGVGATVEDDVALAVGVGTIVEDGVALAVGVDVAVADGVALAVAVAVTVGVGFFCVALPFRVTVAVFGPLVALALMPMVPPGAVPLPVGMNSTFTVTLPLAGIEGGTLERLVMT